MKKLILIALIFTTNLTKMYGQVGIGTTNPSSSAALDINSTNSGLLIPRVNLTSTTDVVTVASPATSLLIYNTATVSDVVPGFYYWDTKWNLLQDSKIGTDWKVSGNSISTGSFLGTTNNEDLVLKVNNSNVAKFDKNTSITLGSSTISTGVANSIILGNASAVSSPNSMALGHQTAVSGRYATALGYQAVTSQDYAVVLGSTNSNSKIGIGTSSPDERLHIVGSVKIVDGTQGNGNILSSDANGKAGWETTSSFISRLNSLQKKYGERFITSSVSNFDSNANISFGSSGPSSGVTLNAANIGVTTAGDYKVTYTVNFQRGNGNGSHTFVLKKETSEIGGSSIFVSGGNGDINSVTKTKFVTLAAGETISVFYKTGGTIALLEGTSLSLELIK